MTLVEDRAHFEAGLAGRLVGALDGPAGHQGLPARLSRHFAYRADDQRLFVLAGPQEAAAPPTFDLALAYGLSYAGDRDLTVVLPAGTAEATLRRAAWLDVPVQVAEYDPDGPAPEPRPLVIPARAVVLDELRTRPPACAPSAPSPDRVAPAAPLARWADEHPELRPAHREGYWAWHCRGRSVLRILPAATGLLVQAGVDHADGGERFVSPLELRVTGALAAGRLDELRRVVEAAIDRRLNGTDRERSEHWFQAVLKDGPELLGLEGGSVVRELPAFRPEAGTPFRRGFADLAGVTWDGRIGLVETKLGADPMLVLQGLDYWTWATAHRERLADCLGAWADRGVELIFGVDARDGRPRISSHTAAQAQALAGPVRWRFVGVDDWFAGTPRATPLDPRTVPEGHAIPRFAERLQVQLARDAPGPVRQRAFLWDPADGVLPGAMQARQSLQERDLLHGMDAHLRSSQRFALNLFAPLAAAAVARLLADLFGDLPAAADPVAFAFADPQDRLRERHPASPHQTQVDVLLRGTATDGRRLAALVEVKLSERDFGPCPAYQRRRNPTRGVCFDEGPFGSQPARCFQLQGDPRAGPRTYDHHLGQVGPLPGHAGCLLRLGLNQPMRNLALARALLADREIDQAVYVLCAHDRNAPIWRRWADVARVFGPDPAVRLAELPASRVVALHRPTDAEWLRRHYALP